MMGPAGTGRDRWDVGSVGVFGLGWRGGSAIRAPFSAGSLEYYPRWNITCLLVWWTRLREAFGHSGLKEAVAAIDMFELRDEPVGSGVNVLYRPRPQRRPVTGV